MDCGEMGFECAKMVVQVGGTIAGVYLAAKLALKNLLQQSTVAHQNAARLRREEELRQAYADLAGKFEVHITDLRWLAAHTAASHRGEPIVEVEKQQQDLHLRTDQSKAAAIAARSRLQILERDAGRRAFLRQLFDKAHAHERFGGFPRDQEALKNFLVANSESIAAWRTFCEALPEELVAAAPAAG